MVHITADTQKQDVSLETTWSGERVGLGTCQRCMCIIPDDYPVFMQEDLPYCTPECRDHACEVRQQRHLRPSRRLSRGLSGSKVSISARLSELGGAAACQETGCPAWKECIDITDRDTDAPSDSDNEGSVSSISTSDTRASEKTKPRSKGLIGAFAKVGLAIDWMSRRVACVADVDGIPVNGCHL